jgi:hypothetical protein
VTVLHMTNSHDTSYAPARGHVLLLSCMDPRVLDDTVQFMNHDNLANRYDHVILAGAALGALGGCTTAFAHWRRTFFDHLEAAHKLHHIEDVYILEHRHCGAYHKVFKVAPEFGDTPDELAKEAACHHKYAKLLEREIDAWGQQKGISLCVKSFLMDLRGKVCLLNAKPNKRRTK